MPRGAPPRRRLEVRGELLTLREIAERYGIRYDRIRNRYYVYGLEGEDLIKPCAANQKAGLIPFLPLPH